MVSSTGIYSRAPIFGHSETLEAVAAGRSEHCAPIHVRLEVTENCNFGCKFCYYHDPDRHGEAAAEGNFNFTAKRQSDLGRMLKLIDELVEIGTQAVSFTGGGDPMMFPRMPKLLDHIYGHRLKFGVTSNLAMALGDAAIVSLARAAWIRWSLNAGTAETYRAINAPKGKNDHRAFSRVRANIARLIAERDRLETDGPKITASFIVTPDNEADIYRAAELSRELGVDGISYRPDTPYARRRAPNRWSDRAANLLDQAGHDLSGADFFVEAADHRGNDALIPDEENLLCRYMNHSTFIAANGDVYPCCYTRIDSKYVIGNVGDENFIGFWNSDQRRAAYRNIKVSECPACPYNETNAALEKLENGEARSEEFAAGADQITPFI